MDKKIEYWLSNRRFVIVIIIMLIIWTSFLTFLYFKAEEVTKDPCSVCAKRLNKEVWCSLSGGGQIAQRTYYPNLTIKNLMP